MPESPPPRENAAPDSAQFITRFAAWAATRPDIRCALILGSRGQGQADRWSDVDPVFISRRADLYADPDRWLPDLGRFWTLIYDPRDFFGGFVTGRSLFAVRDDGLVVDFMILPERLTRWWLRMVRVRWLRRRLGYEDNARQVAHTLRSGFEVVLDRDGWVDRLERSLPALPASGVLPPTQAQFDAAIRDFWYGPARIVGLLHRGKWFAVRTEIDKPGKRLLLQMAEWHARSQGAWQDGEGYRPKHIAHWADAALVAALPDIFGSYGENLWQALFALQDGYHRLARETAANLGLTYPPLPVDEIIHWTHAQYGAWTGH